LSTKTDKWIEENAYHLIEHTRAIVRIPSVEGPAIEAAPAKPAPAPGYPPIPATPPMPFGAKVREVEDYFLKVAGVTYGFPVKENGGYYGYVDAGVEEGVDKEMLGIVCHLDVVPAGDGWEYPPFSSDIVDGKIIGRGTVDDKGPAMATLYAMRAVQECGYKFKRQVRLILGLNEETNMAGVAKYLECERTPDITFTPDGTYPVCNSEFGILHCTFKKEYDSAITMNVGEAANIVPALAVAKVGDKEYRTEGIQCHASTPWEGDNAAQKMIKLLAGLNLEGEDGKVLQVLDKYLGEGCRGESFGLFYEDETGCQSVNLGVIRWNDKGFEITLDLRCPNAVKEEVVKKALCDAFAECGAECIMWAFKPGFYFDPDTEIVKKLMQVYQNRTGDVTSKPFSMGGGTYARVFPNAVSFGPEGYMDVCTCHVPNEYISFEQLKFTTKMIADAIIALACED